jgi:hypothetical protein
MCVKLDICNTSVLLSLTVVPIPLFVRGNIHGTPKVLGLTLDSISCISDF